MFIIFLTNNYFEQGLYKQYKEEKWLKFKPLQSIFADYTTNPVMYLTELLHSTNFKIDVCEYEEISFTTNNFKGTHVIFK